MRSRPYTSGNNRRGAVIGRDHAGDEAMDKALVDLAVYLYRRESLDDPADHREWLRETCAMYEDWLTQTVEIATVSRVV